MLLRDGYTVNFARRSTLLDATDLLPFRNTDRFALKFWERAQPSLVLLQVSMTLDY